MIGRLTVSLAWYDLWVGVFVSRDAIYACPLPCVLFKWLRKSRGKRGGTSEAPP